VELLLPSWLPLLLLLPVLMGSCCCCLLLQLLPDAVMGSCQCHQPAQVLLLLLPVRPRHSHHKGCRSMGHVPQQQQQQQSAAKMHLHKMCCQLLDPSLLLLSCPLLLSSAVDFWLPVLQILL
jgi:hypothetical protein